jgi:hypothetical protein
MCCIQICVEASAFHDWDEGAIRAQLVVVFIHVKLVGGLRKVLCEVYPSSAARSASRDTIPVNRGGA